MGWGIQYGVNLLRILTWPISHPSHTFLTPLFISNHQGADRAAGDGQLRVAGRRGQEPQGRHWRQQALMAACANELSRGHCSQLIGTISVPTVWPKNLHPQSSIPLASIFLAGTPIFPASRSFWGACVTHLIRSTSASRPVGLRAIQLERLASIGK